MKAVIVPALLAAIGGLSACASNTGTKGTANMAIANDPMLPETVSAVPSFNPGSGSVDDAQRSLAREVEMNASAQPAAYAGATPGQLASVSRQSDVVMPETVPVPAAVEPMAGASKAQDAGPTLVKSVVDAPIQVAKAVASVPIDAAKAVGDSLPELFGRSPEGVAHTRAAPEGRLGPDGEVAARSPELDRLIKQYADYYDVPEDLVRRVAKRESTFNPKARNGIYMGLMQIAPATARGMGYRGASAGLLDAETNLKYAVRYLRGAYVVAKGDHHKADRLYQTGYYYHAKRVGLLDETGVGVDRNRRRRL